MVTDVTRAERELYEARSNSDPVRYATLCDKLGVEPQDQMLYEHGLAEIAYLAQRREEERALEPQPRRQRRVGQATIDAFLRDAAQVGDNNFEWHEHYRAILVERFPNRFGPNGEQPINRYPHTPRGIGQVGRIFKRLVDTYQER